MQTINVVRAIHNEALVDHHERQDGGHRVGIYVSRGGYRLPGGGGSLLFSRPGSRHSFNAR